MLCYRKFPVAKKFMKKKREGRLSKFTVERFLSQRADKIRRGIFSYHYFRVSKKLMLQRVLSRLSVEFFCLTVPKHFVEGPFCAVLQKDSGGKKVYGKERGRGSIETFRRKFFLLKCRNIS